MATLDSHERCDEDLRLAVVGKGREISAANGAGTGRAGVAEMLGVLQFGVVGGQDTYLTAPHWYVFEGRSAAIVASR